MSRLHVSRSILVAGAVALLATLWMLTGIGNGSNSNPPQAQRATQAAVGGEYSRQPTVRVAVRDSQARPVTREILVSARTEPNRRVELRAETEGRVVAIAAERGSAVRSDEPLLRIDTRDREARVTEAKAVLEQRELEYQAAQRLEGRQLTSQVQIADAHAQLASARAALAQVELDLARTTITAPFDAIVHDRLVELGDYVGVGDAVAQLVDTDPLIVVGDVSEREVGEIQIGSIGQARLLSGAMVEGRVRYIAPVAEAATRTFRIELEIPNPDRSLRAGMTTDVRVAAGEMRGHFLSSALLTLDDRGSIGVKAVDDRNLVQFYPVDIVRSGSDGIWVTGLPEETRLITVGQGFVNAGQRVEAIDDPSLAASPTELVKRD